MSSNPEDADGSESSLGKIGKIVDRALIQKILRDSEADQSIEVVSVSIRPATSKGDNYTSDMFRASLEYRKRGVAEIARKTLIVKVEPLAEGPQREMIAKSSLFSTEISMMGDTLARMNELLHREDSSAEPLNARGLFARSEPPQLLLMEDLAPLGFRMADRRAGLDMDHCLLAIRGLARFHAASVALCEREPREALRYARGMFNRKQPAEMRRYFVQGTKHLAEEAATWPELDPRIPAKIRAMAEGVYERGCQACESRADDFNVINHGDFWVNNMLFRYNESERPVAHIFVDFQLCVYSSPGVDLNYFFNTSLTDDALHLHEETLLHEYTRYLAAAMASADCSTPAPSVQRVKAMLRERMTYGMIASFTILPVLLACKSEVQDLNELLASEPGRGKNPVYSGELYRKTMLRRLPKFDQMGLLD